MRSIHDETSESAPRTGCGYDLLAIDLDGTLLRPDGSVSPANIGAVERAREAGLSVIVCTGRGYVESKKILGWIAQEDAVIVAGGSITACGRTGETLHRFAMHPTIVGRVVEVIHEHAQPALVLKDAPAAGYDYLIVAGEDEHPLDPIASWWFEEMGATVRFARSLDLDEHPEQTIRVGICTDDHRSSPIASRLRDELGDTATLHDFPAVLGPAAGTRRVNVLEVFDSRATKWASVERLARERGVGASRVAAIGDEINDVSMIAGAGLGIAMGNAVDAVFEVADRRTLANTEDGVAHAIDRILSGAW